jgi:hypothetical protein
MTSPSDRITYALYRSLLPGEEVLAFAAVNAVDGGYIAATTRRVLLHTKFHLETSTSIPYPRIVAVSLGSTSAGRFGSRLGVRHLILHLLESNVTVEILDPDKLDVIHDAILRGVLDAGVSQRHAEGVTDDGADVGQQSRLEAQRSLVAERFKRLFGGLARLGDGVQRRRRRPPRLKGSRPRRGPGRWENGRRT